MVPAETEPPVAATPAGFQGLKAIVPDPGGTA